MTCPIDVVLGSQAQAKLMCVLRAEEWPWYVVHMEELSLDDGWVAPKKFAAQEADDAWGFALAALSKACGSDSQSEGADYTPYGHLMSI